MADFIGMQDVVGLKLPEDDFGEASDAPYRETAEARSPGRITVFLNVAFTVATLACAPPPNEDRARSVGENVVSIETAEDPAAEGLSEVEAEGYQQWFEALPEEDLGALVDPARFAAVHWDGTGFRKA